MPPWSRISSWARVGEASPPETASTAMAQNPALKHDANANLIECSPPKHAGWTVSPSGAIFATTAVLALMCINRDSGAANRACRSAM